MNLYEVSSTLRTKSHHELNGRAVEVRISHALSCNIVRLLPRLGFSATLALCLSNMHPRSMMANHPQGGGVGTAFVGQYFGGTSQVTSTKVRLHPMVTYIEGAAIVNYHMRHHQLKLLDGSYGPEFTGYGGFYSTGTTGSGDFTNFGTYYCIDIGSIDSRCTNVNTGIVEKTDNSPEMYLTLERPYGNTCVSDCSSQRNVSPIVWRIHVQWGGSSGASRSLPQYPVSAGWAPITVVESRQGVHTTDTSAINDIYLQTHDHMYATYPECQSGCSGSYSYSPMFLSPVQTQGSGTLVWQDTNTGGGWSMCFGNTLGTPCGCVTCSAPSFQPNWFWNAPEVLPLRYQVIGSGLVTSAAQSAADLWSSSLGLPYPAIQGGTIDPDIIILEVTSGWSWGGEVMGHAYPILDTLDWGCSPQITQKPLSTVLIEVNAQDFQLTKNTYTASECTSCPTPGAGTATSTPFPVTVTPQNPVDIVVSHEVGHALGVAHNLPVCNQVPDGWSVQWHVLCEGFPAHSRDITVNWPPQIHSGDQHAAACSIAR